MKAVVVRLRRKGGQIVQDCDVYIGRRLCMGGWNLNSIKDGSADVACRRFEKYILEKPELIARLSELRGKRLGCWCKHKGSESCHGDVLLKLLQEQDTAQLKEKQPEVPISEKEREIIFFGESKRS